MWWYWILLEKCLGKMETFYIFIGAFSLKTFNAALKNDLFKPENSYSHTAKPIVTLTVW